MVTIFDINLVGFSGFSQVPLLSQVAYVSCKQRHDQSQPPLDVSPSRQPYGRPRLPLYMQKVWDRRKSTHQSDVVPSQPWRKKGQTPKAHARADRDNSQSACPSFFQETKTTIGRGRGDGRSRAYIQASHCRIELGTCLTASKYIRDGWSSGTPMIGRRLRIMSLNKPRDA